MVSKRILAFLALVLFVLFLSSSAFAAPTFDTLVDRYFHEYFVRNPTSATYDGFHQFDARLEDYSRAAVQADIAEKRRLLMQFRRLDRSRYSVRQQADYALVVNAIEASLLDDERVRGWEKNPDRYSSGISSSVFILMARRFAPAERRLALVIARERQMPAVFDAARVNLKNPPRIFTEIAIEQLPDIVGFFQKDVPSAFKDVTDADLLARFKASNDAVIASLQKYQDWLQHDLLPRSHGDFRIGAQNFRNKLHYEEMVDIPLNRLLAVGYADLRRNQRRFKAVAARLDPHQSAMKVLALLAHDHPRPQDLLQDFRNVLDGLRDFIVKHQIIDIPSKVMPILEETPPFDRALTMASMDTPGPYEKKATEAYFNVTLPEPNWSPQEVEEHMAGFNYGTIISTAIHEAFPGHYVQFLWMHQIPSKIRKLLGCNTNAEGWAHYCEQMMLDEGYGGGDAKLRLGQLQDALLRDARFIVGIKMHTGQMTFNQAVDFFVKEGFQSRANGLRETKRGTSDPTYLYYTLGKLEILKLRADCRKKWGARFTLRRFHDAFMRQGFPPIKIIRRALLGNDSPVL